MVHPFVTHEAPETPAARQGGRVISRAAFMGDVAALAAILRPGRYVMNLCNDRYRFAVAFGAALTRGQVTILPPNETPVMLAQLTDAYDGLTIVTDRETHHLPAPVLRFPDRLAGPANSDVPAFPATQDAVILFTSGSTGQPQPQGKTWGALVASTRAAGRALDIARLKGATVVGTVPLQHSYGLESTVMLALQHGLVMDAGRPFYPADVAAALAANATRRILVTTPVHLRALVQGTPAMPGADLVLSATAPLAPALAKEAQAAFGGRLMEIYGCSEAGQIALRRSTETPVWQTIEGLTLRQEGETTFVSGAPIVEHEVLLHDAIELHSPTRFMLFGRTGDLVNIAGKRSSIGYLNAHLNAIEGVRDGVFVMPPETGVGAVRLMAFVVAPGLSASAIMTALRQRIDPAFLPRPLCLVEALPRNAMGKLPSAALRKLVEDADVS